MDISGPGTTNINRYHCLVHCLRRFQNTKIGKIKIHDGICSHDSSTDEIDNQCHICPFNFIVMISKNCRLHSRLKRIENCTNYPHFLAMCSERKLNLECIQTISFYTAEYRRLKIIFFCRKTMMVRQAVRIKKSFSY